jgi:hypothetical protein
MNDYDKQLDSRVNWAKVAQSGKNFFGAAIPPPPFKLIDLTKSQRPREFWASLLI